MADTAPRLPTEPVHVAYFIDQLCENGGAERMLLKTIRLLPKQRFRCSLITFKLNSSHRLFRDLPCPHFVYPLRRTYDWDAFRTARLIRELLRKEKVQIVHTFHETADLWGGFISKVGRGRILVSSRRDMGILRTFKHDIAYRALNPMFDLVLTVSEEVRQFCIQQDHLPPQKVATLYNGLEPKNISAKSGSTELARELGIGPSTPIIATVGNVRPVKGIDVLVETAGMVAAQKPEILFLVIGPIGDREYFRKVQDRINHLGLSSKVRFLGETDDVAALLRGCDIFFLPSRSEGFSNALIEAMACGLPCVASRVGGNGEALLHGKSGYLIESEDARTAGEHILTLLGNPELARKMGSAGRETVESRFTSDVMIRELVGHYERLLNSRLTN